MIITAYANAVFSSRPLCSIAGHVSLIAKSTQRPHSRPSTTTFSLCIYIVMHYVSLSCFQLMIAHLLFLVGESYSLSSVLKTFLAPQLITHQSESGAKFLAACGLAARLARCAVQIILEIQTNITALRRLQGCYY